MAKIKVVGSNNGLRSNFNNVTSQTIFSFGRFTVTTNLENRRPIDYTNQLTSFASPISLDSLGISQEDMQKLTKLSNDVVLNLDNSNLLNFVRFGSTEEYMRAMIENIIQNYVGSLFISSRVRRGGNETFSGYSYNQITKISEFKVPLQIMSVGNNVEIFENNFGLIFDDGNNTIPDNNELRNLNISYDKYVIHRTYESSDVYPIIGFTGDTESQPYLTIRVLGDVFGDVLNSSTIGFVDFHIKPNTEQFERFRTDLREYDRYMIGQRNGDDGFAFKIDSPTLLDDGNIRYSETKLLWPTSDGYNIDVNGTSYSRFINSLITIAKKYDTVKNDLIFRMLTPKSLKQYDLTDDEKISKLLRVYGRQFDQLKIFIDALVNINRLSYDKKNNIPDRLLGNLARTLGWDYFSLLNEKELVESFFSIDETERNLNDDLMPGEIDIELWRRILQNTNYFWKSKGTRHAIKSMFLLIGIPEPFIDITEYVYTVDGVINPDTVGLNPVDFPNEVYPFDDDGYPKAPPESNDFYFQISGNTDGGQAYMDNFRNAGFVLLENVDNKKSWVQAGAITRRHPTTPRYFQEDSKLILNTKMVDVALDVSRGVEYDVYRYIKDVDFPATTTAMTVQNIFVNMSVPMNGVNERTFNLPSNYDPNEGDIEVRFDGILLNGEKTYNVPINEIDHYDYIIDVTGGTFTITGSGDTSFNEDFWDAPHVIQVTYISETSPISGVTIEYSVLRVKPQPSNTEILLPSTPRGSLQLTINGIALTKGTSQLPADYFIDNDRIVIQNNAVIQYLSQIPDNYLMVAYMTLTGNTSLTMQSERGVVGTGKVVFSAPLNAFLFKSNYRIASVNDVKVLVDGIMLQPVTDYRLSTSNPFDIILPRRLNLGSVVTIYYLTAGEDFFNPIVSTEFGLGDISELSFLEFIELLHEKAINATNRKTITDHRGGWYPTLLNIYITYLRRSQLTDENGVPNPLLSNGYDFNMLFNFLKKYNTFFQRFVDQLLPTTIILKKSGLVIRNTVFTQQKFMYRRGVSFNTNIKTFGDDGATYLKQQPDNTYAWTTQSVPVGVAER